MRGHTEGPWHREGLAIVGVFRTGIVASTPAIHDGGVFEREANARLIAAAPELLEALREIVNGISGRDCGGNPRTDIHALDWVDKTARAAIRKATGEEA